MNRKALSPLVSYILLTLLVLTGIGLVTDISIPIFEGVQDTEAIAANRQNLAELDTQIRGTAGYGEGSRATHSLSFRRGEYIISPSDDSITYTLHTDADLNPGVSTQFGSVFMRVSNETGRKTVTLKVNYTDIDITGGEESLLEGLHRLTLLNRGETGGTTEIEVTVE